MFNVLCSQSNFCLDNWHVIGERLLFAIVGVSLDKKRYSTLLTVKPIKKNAGVTLRWISIPSRVEYL